MLNKSIIGMKNGSKKSNANKDKKISKNRTNILLLSHFLGVRNLQWRVLTQIQKKFLYQFTVLSTASFQKTSGL